MEAVKIDRANSSQVHRNGGNLDTTDKPQESQQETLSLNTHINAKIRPTTIKSVAVSELKDALPTANYHLKNFPYVAPHNVQDCVVHYEGSFDPFGPHHMDILQSALDLGFKSATIGLCHQNPRKPRSSAFEDRKEIILAWLRSRNIAIAENPGEPGVYIEQDPDMFQFQKLIGFYDNNLIHLMGPDNFELYYIENVCWSHVPIIQDNRTGRHRYGFRQMYLTVDGFREKVLVYPRLHDIHSTDIRDAFHKSGNRTTHDVTTGSELGVFNDTESNINKNSELKVDYISAVDKITETLPLEVVNVVNRRALYQTPASSTKIKLDDVKSNTNTNRGRLYELRDDIKESLSKLMASTFGASSLHKINSKIDEAILHMDASELVELKRLLGKENTSVQITADNMDNSKFAKKILYAILDSMINGNTQVAGDSLILQSQESSRPIILCINSRGWIEHGMISYTLRNNGLKGVEDKLVFFSSQLSPSNLVDQAIARRGLNYSRLSGNAESDALKIAAALNSGLIPVIDLNHIEDADPSEYLKFYLNSLAQHNTQGVDIYDAVIINCENAGADSAFDSNTQDAFWATEDLPYFITFNSPQELRDLLTMH